MKALVVLLFLIVGCCSHSKQVDLQVTNLMEHGVVIYARAGLMTKRIELSPHGVYTCYLPTAFLPDYVSIRISETK